MVGESHSHLCSIWHYIGAKNIHIDVDVSLSFYHFLHFPDFVLFTSKLLLMESHGSCQIIDQKLSKKKKNKVFKFGNSQMVYPESGS